MGVGEGDNRDGRKKDGKETGVGEKETGMGERKIERQEREREIGRKTAVGERERREKEKKITNKKNSWNFILWYFTPQNGVKHDSGM